MQTKHPRATLRLLGTNFGSLGGSWGHFGRSWASLGELLGGLGVVLGGLGALSGGSWGGLGRSCGDLEATFGAVKLLIVFLIDFGRPKGAQREAFWEPKRSQNRSQNEVEI